MFAIACLYGLRGDIALVSFAPLARSWGLVALAVSCSLLNYAFRVIRWQRYLARLGTSLPLGFTSLTYIAGFAFTVFVERLMDVMAMLVLAALIVAAAPRYHVAMWSAAVIVVAVLATLAVMPWSSFAGVLESQTRLPRGVARLGVGVAQGLAAARSLLSPGALLFGFLLGLVAWGFEGVGLYMLGSLFPAAHLGVATGVGVYAVAVLVGALSFLPGGLGGTEAVMTALLAAQGFAVADALLVTIVCRVVTLWLAVLIGWIAILVLRQRPVPTVPSWP